MLDEFKKFIFKGDVIALSTGVIIGGAFGKIVDAFTAGVVNPLLSLLTGGGKEAKVDLKVGPFDLGVIISALIMFLITAAIIFFCIVKPANAMLAKMKKAEAPAAPAAPPEDVKLLAEIRDLLKR